MSFSTSNTDVAWTQLAPWLRSLLCLAVLAGLPLLALPAAAQDARSAALFRAGKQLMKQGNYDAACPKLEKSYDLEPALGTLLNLALCHEKQGRLATSWTEWRKAAAQARAAGDGPRATLAERHVTALEPRLPMLRINVWGEAPELTITRDGETVDPTMYGVDVPVDPGKHTVVVARGEDVALEKVVEAGEGEKKQVEIDLKEAARTLPPIPPPPPDTEPTASAEPPSPPPTAEPPPALPPTATAPAPPPPSPPAPAPPPADPPGTWRSGFGVWMMALGGHVGLNAVMFLIIASQMQSGAEEDRCFEREGTMLCSDDGLNDLEVARMFADMGQWFGIGGLTVFATGVVMVATAPSRDEADATAGIRLAPLFSADGGVQLQLRGSF